MLSVEYFTVGTDNCHSSLFVHLERPSKSFFVFNFWGSFFSGRDGVKVRCSGLYDVLVVAPPVRPN